MRYPATGRCDDLLALFARAEEKGEEPMSWGSLEAPCNLIGRLLAAAAEFLPKEFMLRIHDRVLKLLSGQDLPFDDGPNFQSAMELARGLKSSVPPSLLCLISHPPASGPWALLNVELMRHALRALRRLRGRPCRPRMLIAIDSFALDMLPPLKVFLYAGFMGHYHVGLDRLAHARGFLSRLVMGRTAWPSVALRIARHFERGGEMGMVLAGGVPTTSRVLYGSREFLQRLIRGRPRKNPTEVRRALLDEPGFSDFLRTGAIGERLKSSIWRAMEAWAIARASEGENLEEARRGVLAKPARSALESCALALRYPKDEARRRLREFEEEYARQTPWRERLFSFLAGRASRRPLVLVPLTHSADGARLSFGSSAALLGLSRPGVLRLRWKRGQAWVVEETTVHSFSREFVQKNFL